MLAVETPGEVVLAHIIANKIKVSHNALRRLISELEALKTNEPGQNVETFSCKDLNLIKQIEGTMLPAPDLAVKVVAAYQGCSTAIFANKAVNLYSAVDFDDYAITPREIVMTFKASMRS